MKHLIKCVVMYVFCLSSALLAAGHRDSIADMVDAMTLRMERQFSDMFTRMEHMDDPVQRTDNEKEHVRLDTYARNAAVSEDADSVGVAVAIDKSVSVKDVLIELENGVLRVLVEKPERIEICVEEHWLTMTAERRVSGAFSAISCASQQLTLPSVIDVSTVQADLTEGMLTLTFKKNADKNRQRITVTEGRGKQTVTCANETLASARASAEK